MFYMVQAVDRLNSLGSGIEKHCTFHFELILQEAALRLNLRRYDVDAERAVSGKN